MMENLLISVLEVSVSVSLTVLLLVLLAPFLNRRYAARWKCWIWIFLAVRLMIPASGQGILEKIMPQEEIMPQQNVPARPAGIPQRRTAAWPVQAEAAAAVRENQKTISVSLPDIAAAVWLCGFVLFLAVHAASFLHYRKRMLKHAVPVTDGLVPVLMEQLGQEMHIRRCVPVLECPLAASPMMTGTLHPVLLLPRGQYGRHELYFILKHELVHYQHRDLHWKMLLLTANAVHWFNPLIWIMGKEAAADMELACDERVTQGAGPAGCRAYTEALLSAIQKNCARGNAFTTQFYGGKRMMKKRFQNIFLRTGKKNGMAVLAAAVILTVSLGAAAGCAVKKTDSGAQGNRNRQQETESGRETAADSRQPEAEKEQETAADSRQPEAEKEPDNENGRQPEDGDADDSYSQMAGIWMIDFDKTDAGIWGTGVSYGNEMEISDTGELRYYIGIGNGGTGQCEQDGNGISVEIEPYEEHGMEPEILAFTYDSSSAGEQIHMDWHGEDVWWKRAESTGNTGDGQAEPFIMLSLQKEGLEEKKRATLAAGNGFSLYLPDGEWLEDGPDSWRAAVNGQIKIWAEHSEGMSSDDAGQALAEEGYTSSDSGMEKQDGGVVIKADILQSENTVWKLFYSYPVQAEEGWGRELRAIADTFAVLAEGSGSQTAKTGNGSTDSSQAEDDEQEIRQRIDQFLELYFQGSASRDLMQSYLAASYEGDIDVHQGGSISELKTKVLSDEAPYGNGTYGAAIEFRDSAYPDMFQYMEIIFVREEGEWKISSYGLTG